VARNALGQQDQSVERRTGLNGGEGGLAAREMT